MAVQLLGGPGTGKSYTLNLIRKGLFEDTLHWQQGVQYQVVTFQAVMAEALAGDTIHHALGLNWAGSGEGSGLKRLLELSLATLQWRWLIIDEFSVQHGKRRIIRAIRAPLPRDHAGPEHR